PYTTLFRSRRRHEMPVAVGIDFDGHVAISAVRQAPARCAAMFGVEGDGSDSITVVCFPLVELAVFVGVLFGADETSLPVVLDAGDFAVRARGDFESRERLIGIEVLPRVFLAV